MTDLEMTKLCAEAMGIKFSEGVGLWRDGRTTGYDPLHNDAQAMALVKKLGLSIRKTDPDRWDVWQPMGVDGSHSNINRAIVECVAKMQRVKHD